MNNKVLISLIVFFIFSCKSYNEVFLYNKRDSVKEQSIIESNKDRCIFIIFESTMINNRIFLQEFNSRKIIFEDSLTKSDNFGISEMIIAKNSDI